MNRHCLILIFGFVFALGLSRSWSDTFAPDQIRYKNVFSQTLDKLNKALKEKKIPVVTANERDVRVDHINPPWGNNIVEVNINPKFSAAFFPNSYGITELYRDIPLDWLGSYDSPPKPTWTPEQAIKEAMFWYEAVIGKLPKNISKPTATFEPQPNGGRYREGKWTVEWPRMDKSGHQFQMDNIRCILYEKWGPEFLSCLFISNFKEGQKMALTAKQAIKVALPVARKLLTAPITSRWSKGFTVENDPTAELKIINPNHMLNYNSVDDASYEIDLGARLVWIVKYRTSNDKGTKVYIYLWIDTETKEVIGGDFNDE